MGRVDGVRYLQHFIYTSEYITYFTILLIYPSEHITKWTSEPINLTCSTKDANMNSSLLSIVSIDGDVSRYIERKFFVKYFFQLTPFVCIDF